MRINSNIGEVIKLFNRFASETDNIDFGEALIAGVNEALGMVKYRVFNTGRDSKNIAFGKYVGKKTRATNRKFKVKRFGDPELNKERKKKRKNLKEDASEGTYTEYEKLRLAEGRQIKYKDLEFHGTLRRGIQVVKESNRRAVASVTNDKLVKIIQGQEAQLTRIIGTPIEIFSLNQEEREKLITTAVEGINEIYARIFSTKNVNG